MFIFIKRMTENLRSSSDKPKIPYKRKMLIRDFNL